VEFGIAFWLYSGKRRCREIRTLAFDSVESDGCADIPQRIGVAMAAVSEMTPVTVPMSEWLR
jgi:hypothetical protein